MASSLLTLLVGMLGVCMVSSQFMNLLGGGEGTPMDPMLFMIASRGPGPKDMFSVQMRVAMAQMKAKFMAQAMGQANNQRTILMFTMQELQRPSAGMMSPGGFDPTMLIAMRKPDQFMQFQMMRQLMGPAGGAGAGPGPAPGGANAAGMAGMAPMAMAGMLGGGM